MRKLTTECPCCEKGWIECFEDCFSIVSGHYTRDWHEECEYCGGTGKIEVNLEDFPPCDEHGHERLRLSIYIDPSFCNENRVFVKCDPECDHEFEAHEYPKRPRRKYRCI